MPWSDAQTASPLTLSVPAGSDTVRAGPAPRNWMVQFPAKVHSLNAGLSWGISNKPSAPACIPQARQSEGARNKTADTAQPLSPAAWRGGASGTLKGPSALVEP
jgi:hypothetical protein